MREVVTHTGVPRDFICPRGHVWEVVGEATWNPWGDPDWRCTPGATDCPECGQQGSRAVTVNPDGLPLL